MRISLVLVSGLAACKSKPKPEPGVVESCALANDKQVVTVTGYLVTPLMTNGCGKTCVTELSDDWDYSSKQRIQLVVPVGSGPLSMESIPANTYMVDSYYFGLTDSDGKRRPVQSRLRVTGTLEAREFVDDGRYDASLKGTRSMVCMLTPTEVHGVEPEKR